MYPDFRVFGLILLIFDRGWNSHSKSDIAKLGCINVMSRPAKWALNR